MERRFGLPRQEAWNGYINTAFTVPRFVVYVPFAPEVAGPPGPFGRRPDFPSGSAAADGDPPKKPILEGLRNAGISP
jgi:hypothetical protein